MVISPALHAGPGFEPVFNKLNLFFLPPDFLDYSCHLCQLYVCVTFTDNFTKCISRKSEERRREKMKWNKKVEQRESSIVNERI